MKFALACLLASLALAASVQAGNIRDLEGHYYEHRPRLGHFKDQPFIDLYKHYAAAFLFPNQQRDPDDYRNYLPSGDECMVFFRSFRIHEYKVAHLEEFVVLDACLGYLFESTYHEKDQEQSKQVAENLAQLQGDETLRALYEGTKVTQLDESAQKCVGDLLYNSILAKKQFSDVTCNSHWIQVFLQFAQCHKQIPEELRDTDSYFSRIYEIVRERGNKCFNHEIGEINRAVRDRYANNPFYRARTAVSFSPLKKQSNDRMLPKEVVELLLAVQGFKSSRLNLREVHAVIRGVSQKDTAFIRKLTGNMAEFATQKVAPKRNSKAYKKDPSGSATYERLVDDMCLYFRRSDNKDYYDYATPLIRMVEMLRYEEIFGISEADFATKVLRHSYESGALYLCVSSCNLLTFTEAAYVDAPHNGPLKFQVAFKPDTSTMVQWPNAGFY